jgi:hypothetical protein
MDRQASVRRGTPPCSRAAGFGLPSTIRRHIAGDLVGSLAEEIALHLLLQILARSRFHQVQTIFVDEHRLITLPFLPRLLGDVLEDALAEHTRQRRPFQPLGFPTQLDAKDRPCHRFSFPVHCNALTNTFERR